MKILFRADDAGSSHSANRAILECVRAGVVRNVSFMVPGPGFEIAVENIGTAKNIDFGLHVTLNAEWDRVRWGPVTQPHDVPSLVMEDGSFTHSPADLHGRGFCIDEAMTEVGAQLAYARQCGLRLDYLDEHMSVGWIGLAEPLAEFARREGLVFRPDLPCVPDEHHALECLPHRLARTPDLALHVSHPSHDTSEMRMVGNAQTTGATIARARDQERQMLVDPRLPGMLQVLGAESVRYTSL